MIITRTSLATNKVHTLDLPITEEQITAWQNGVLIQNAFPNLNADQREFLQTGITAEEWETLFEE